MVREDDEAGRVVRIVLDIGGKYIQFVETRCRLAGNRAGSRIGSRHARRFGIAGDRHARQVRQVAIEPFVALRQGLGMGVEFVNAV